ncbi:hypothetical protein DVH24_024231 [Malus domestica]|uniref:Uncharacterized protein n=1 Tax=Malus domestica TaxID=3750 RepID=A0A498JI97_MALDO|nr:hypothetical protein DVH24_024231 [Malus domestica]
MIANCDLEDFNQLITNIANETKASYGLIFNTFEDLEGHALATIRQEYLPNIPIFSQVVLRISNGAKQRPESDTLLTAIPRVHKPYARTGQHSKHQRLLHNHYISTPDSTLSTFNPKPTLRLPAEEVI